MKRFLCAAAVAVVAGSAGAEPERTAFSTLTADQLKSTYLDCERSASRGLVGTNDAAHCSFVHEELKQRVFGGDFERMLAWWQVQQSAMRLRSSGAALRPPE